MFVLEMLKTNLKKTFYLLAIIISLQASDLFSKSTDSPDLDKFPKNKLSWNEWILKTKNDLKNKNYKDDTLNYLDNIKFNPRVIELDRKQPEFRLTFDKYFKNVVNTKSKKKINEQYNQNKTLLKKIELKYNVSAKILSALWGIETSFGKHTGKMDIIRSLASLAYDGRRKEFFTKELENALNILESNHFERNSFKGSWAGAFGQTQFMPSTFLKHAIDFDGDSRVNLFKKPDALASGANYLKKIGWNNNLQWGEEINIQLTNALRKLAKNKVYKDVTFWSGNGIKLNKEYGKSKLKLVIPDSNYNECYLVSKNYDVILNWNRSNYFALTVFLFSDEIK